ncbi:MAG: carbohydrate ABC transporter permease [Clostridia bacterium]|nr:carbohydrate ABC transporter permease [Clostridia bacterium]
MVYVLFASLSDSAQFMQHSGLLFKPLGFTLDSYIATTKHPMIVSGYKNTLLVLIGGLAVNMALTVSGAYVLASSEFRFRKIFNMLITFTMLFSGGMVPTYLAVKAYGLLDSYWALVIPTAISTFNLIIMRTAFAGLPPSLAESARLDGANDFIIMSRIALPLCMPTVAVIILYYGVQHWNAWFQAMLYLQSRQKYPLQLILREILLQNDTSTMTGPGGADTIGMSDTVKYAVIIVSTLPILALYPFLQRFFVKGVMVGAVKG